MNSLRTQIAIMHEPLRLSEWKAPGNDLGQYMLRPTGGLWTVDALTKEAQKVVAREDAATANLLHYLIDPDPDARVLVLDKQSHFRALLPISQRATYSHSRWDHNRLLSPVIARYLAAKTSPIDWISLGQEFDAIWARGYVPPGWLHSSVYWYRPRFADVIEREPAKKLLPDGGGI